MSNFWNIGTLQKFTSVHDLVYNLFNHERHINSREILKQGRTAGSAEWRRRAV